MQREQAVYGSGLSAAKGKGIGAVEGGQIPESGAYK